MRSVAISRAYAHITHGYIQDDDSLLSNMSSNADLGTIKVSIRRVHEHYTLIPFTPATFNAVEKVHERSKKAGAHNVAYVFDLFTLPTFRATYSSLSLASERPRESLTLQCAIYTDTTLSTPWKDISRLSSSDTDRAVSVLLIHPGTPGLTYRKRFCRRKGLCPRLPRRRPR